jgi:hypothetical protein
MIRRHHVGDSTTLDSAVSFGEFVSRLSVALRHVSIALLLSMSQPQSWYGVQRHNVIMGECFRL